MRVPKSVPQVQDGEAPAEAAAEKRYQFADNATTIAAARFTGIAADADGILRSIACGRRRAS